MNKVLRVLLAVFLLIGTARTAGSSATKVEEEIRLLEEKMNEAYAKNDLQTYFSFYAPDFTQWLPEGRSDLEHYKHDWMAFVNAGNSVQAAEIRELVLKVDQGEDAAVASYILHVKMKAADGKISEEDSQETDIWFKRGAAWKVVALHYAPMKKEK